MLFNLKNVIILEIEEKKSLDFQNPFDTPEVYIIIVKEIKNETHLIKEIVCVEGY